MVVSGRLAGWGELWKVPTEPHFVEAAQVILTDLEGLGRLQGSPCSPAVCPADQDTSLLYQASHWSQVILSLLSHCLRPWLIFLSPPPHRCQSLHLCGKQSHDGLSFTPPESLCCQVQVGWCWGQPPQFSCWVGPSSPPPQSRRSFCYFHSQTPQPRGRILQLSCCWSHSVVSHCPLVHPRCLSLHPHHPSLHLPCHLPGIQCQPCCYSLSQRPGLILSESLVSRCWQQNWIGIHFTCTRGDGLLDWELDRDKEHLGEWGGDQALIKLLQ